MQADSLARAVPKVSFRVPQPEESRSSPGTAFRDSSACAPRNDNWDNVRAKLSALEPGGEGPSHMRD
jgi:hypothetical protein